MAVSNSLKRQRLRATWIRAKRQGVRLLAALEDAMLAADDQVQFGQRITSVAGNGSSMGLEAIEGLPVHEAASLFSDLIALYESASTELDVDEADDADGDVHDRMLLLLPDAKSIGSDFSQLCAA